MNDQKFERLLSSIRNEIVDEKVVAQAGERVWQAIAATPTTTERGPGALRTCDDFQALIAGYLSNQMAPARAMLFEDHVHACVACRHALEHAREGESQIVLRLETKRSGPRVWRWAMGTAVFSAVLLAGIALGGGFFPGQHSVRGDVQSADGAVYAVSGPTMQLVRTGYRIRSGEELRTAKGSTAVVRLLDGSLVEMGERADVSVSRGWKGVTIHLDGGQVIVQAAKQRNGRLYVATGDGLVSVKGTIFSVNHGIKGSRVAVIEGVVHVDFGDTTTDLHPGEEATSSTSVSKVPIRNEIAWSRDSAKYLALLGDFAILQKQIAAIPGPGLRYSSELLPYVPDNTVVYAAIPNLANTLGEASRLFQDRLQQSPALRDWWRRQQKGPGPKPEQVIDRIKTFNGYLGDEIVFAVGKEGTTFTAPVILAKVKQGGLEATVQNETQLEQFLQKQSRQLSSNPAEVALQSVHDPWKATPAPGHPLLVYVSNQMLIASPDLVELQRAVTRSREHGSGHFADTPFYQQIAHSYQQGAEWLFCANMEQIVGRNVQGEERKDLPPGIEDVRYLTMEHREVSGKPESHADLTFASARRGVASWLAEPAPMGSLDFVTPNASMVTSAVIKNPKTIMEEMFKTLGNDENLDSHLAEFESKTGVNVLNDLAAPLGGEVTFAFDGPVLPTPSWKLIFEVYDPTTLQSTIEKLVDSFNRQTNNGRTLQLTSKHVGSRTYYAISSRTANGPSLKAEIDYTFVDSYMVAASDIGTISRAIQSRDSGITLTHSQTFQSLLPSDGYMNFSAIFYHNIGPVVGPVAEQLKASGALTQQQRQSIDALTANSAPGLIYAYGEPDRIAVVTNTGFMGFDLGTLMTMGHHGPFQPQMFLGEALTHPPQTQ